MVFFSLTVSLTAGDHQLILSYTPGSEHGPPLVPDNVNHAQSLITGRDFNYFVFNWQMSEC